MKIIRHENPALVWVKGATGPVKSFITFSVQPASHRYWDSERAAWAVQVDHLIDLVKIGEYHTGFVDYSDLGIDLQMFIAQNKSRNVVKSIIQEDPFAVMHLLPTAPQVMIEAAWKALAKLHHPDSGGNEEEFKRVSDAYQRIKKTNGSPT